MELPGRLHPTLANVSGRVSVFVRLRGESVAGSGESLTREQVLAEQAAFVDRILARAPNAEVTASVQLALNGIVLKVDGADLPQLASDISVSRIVPVVDYRQDLSETVPYIGADTSHDFGVTGQGVRIAVIDSGIDYTHKALGGPGTRKAYEAAWAPLPPPDAEEQIPQLTSGGYLVINDPKTKADDGLFPSSKVVGGYDFVGERWPFSLPPDAPEDAVAPLEPDPDPIAAPDATTFGGHGTHVADIIAGKLGVAPAAKVYAVKACSAPATSCSGEALLRAMDFALDPNGDGRIRDRVDIINMSLGSIYGQPFDDDLSLAVDNASKVGVLTVASAGNSADKQFITGSPGAASSALSVAQTQVPSAALQLITYLTPAAGDRGAVFQPWSTPLAGTIEGPVTYPPAAGGKSLACSDDLGANPYAAGEYAGKIVFVDRGTCAISFKVANLAFAGATAAIVGVVNADAPFAASYGGGDATIPGFMISLADGNLLRAGNGVVRLSASNVLPLSGSMASTSSRGPRFDDNIVKPEIAAPGASISADSGGFTATSAFGGTSGAAPMVAGAAALIKSARPFLSAADIKQLLVNTGQTDVYQPPSASTVLPNQLAPITRIGGGEVRVDRALFSPVIVTDVTGDRASRAHGAMSFGYLDASKPLTTLTRKLEVENRSLFPQIYKVKPTLRYADDAATDAVSITATPSTIVVYPFSKTQVKVKLSVDGAKLRKNLMSSGAGGNAIGPLTANEYDGYVFFEGHHHKVSMPWHILPRKSAELVAKVPRGKLPAADPVSGTGSIPVQNNGVGDAQIFAYSLLGTGPDTPRGDRGEGQPNPTIKAAAVNTFLVPGADCGSTDAVGFVWEFVFHMHERKASPVGTFHEVDIDINGDGQVDALVVNGDWDGVTELSDGRQLSYAYNLRDGTAFAGFYVEHATNSRNVILRACGADLGLTQADIGRPVRADFYAYNWYFGGDVESHLGPFRIAPYGEEFAGPVAGALLGYQQSADLPFDQFGLPAGADAHKGLLLINNTDFGSTSRGGATFDTEATILLR